MKPFKDTCAMELTFLCVVKGELQVASLASLSSFTSPKASHPHAPCLMGPAYPTMLKACSEMGTTLYPLQWREGQYVEGPLLFLPLKSKCAVGDVAEAFILPVTLRLRPLFIDFSSFFMAFEASKEPLAHAPLSGPGLRASAHG